MARYIKVDDKVKEAVVKEFITAIMNHKASDGDIKFTKSFGKIDQKTTLKFTADAYWKMISLVDKFSSEVAWHGVTERMEGGGYLIKDIIIYPQVVTGATVVTDQEEYQDWLIAQFDKYDEIKMQGHSHVNMGVTPSGTDTSLYDGILSGLDEDDYYIFLIWNKKNEYTAMIYDNQLNMYFDKADINLVIGDTGELLAEADKVVKKSAPVYTTYNGGYASYGKQNQKPKENQHKKTTGLVSTAKKTKSGNFQKKDKNTYGSYGSYGYYDSYEDEYEEYWRRMGYC